MPRHLATAAKASPAAVVVFLLLAVAYIGVKQFEHRRAVRANTPVVEPGQVVRVIDGDTIEVEGHGKVRMLLVDAPETHNNAHGEKGCFGQTAKQFTASQLPTGTPVNLVLDRQVQDKYGRLLAYVEKQDGTDVGEQLLKQGYAEVLAYKPNVARLDRYQGVQDRAERAELGIWGKPCAP